ncbi:Ammonium transporter 1 [Orchesella cincta]|uniref:Ammonium transporter n=1 Tax=Orchesella cincta TaxID=48709 RepID=A0A1D2MMQ7_ORCCI|nr:Ammonium transporter 1 [Orchesella cincta]
MDASARAALLFGGENHTSTLTPSKEYDPGVVTWLLMTTALTWIMVPGVGFFYNGMARSKSSLSLLMLCLWSCAVVSIQWYFIGFTLCLSDTGNLMIGNVDHLFLRNIDDMPSFSNEKVPQLLASIWYCLFAVITPTIILGGVAERTRFIPTVIFIFFWSTLVFDFLTYWTWNRNGWSFKIGALDFGGGTPVHISTGAAALAFAYMVGKREDTTERPPHNMTHVYIGTSFIWCGWLIANAGSGLYPNLRAVTVMITTNLAASAGAITWSLIDYFRHDRKWSALGFCAGAICGLVSITPASGYVTPSSSLVFGIVGALVCNYAQCSKKFLHADDTFDVFSCHGIGGIVGNILTGVFAQKAVAAVDGQEIDGGWLDGNWAQVGWQLIDTVAGFGWSFVMTALIIFVIDKIPGLHFRASPEEEQEGLDKTELGFSMYDHIEELRVTNISATVPSFISINPLSENGHAKGNGKNKVDNKEVTGIETTEHL